MASKSKTDKIILAVFIVYSLVALLDYLFFIACRAKICISLPF